MCQDFVEATVTIWKDGGRQAAFNDKLKQRTRGGAVVYPDGLKTYDEFITIRPALMEREVLETMRDGGLLTGVYERLEASLRERNRYAHASNVIPSPDQSNRYIDDLVDLLCRSFA